jgi:membrane protein
MGAAIAYYTLFSIAPLLLIAIAVAGMIFGADAARGGIFLQIRGFLGDDGAQAIEGLVKNADQPVQGTVAIVTSVVTMFVGATAVFGELQSSLDRIWQAPERKNGGFFDLVRGRMLTFGMVLGVAFLLMVSLILSAGISALGNFWIRYVSEWQPLLQLLNFVFSAMIFTGLFALIYRFVPRASVAWEDVWIGAAVTAVLFSVGKYLIGLYLGQSSIGSSFGAAGSLVTVLVWVYYSAQVFLLGAEFTWVYARRFGSRSGEGSNAPVATSPQRASIEDESVAALARRADERKRHLETSWKSVERKLTPEALVGEVVELVAPAPPRGRKRTSSPLVSLGVSLGAQLLAQKLGSAIASMRAPKRARAARPKKNGSRSRR